MRPLGRSRKLRAGGALDRHRVRRTAGGAASWTLDLLADEMMVRLTPHDGLSGDTVGRLLGEQAKPWQQKMWCIPKVDAEYVARMEDVLDLYAAPADPKRQWCRWTSRRSS
ncbi:MAG: hypothetical protein IPF99_24455 [Deltaproteobacteria bacterium]|nr:hypothetical protein [Deltaproteobacteria bacterium]